MNELCISVPEMSKRLGISRTSAYSLANSADFYPAFRLGKRVLISIAAFSKWLEERTQPNEQP